MVTDMQEIRIALLVMVVVVVAGEDKAHEDQVLDLLRRRRR